MLFRGTRCPQKFASTALSTPWDIARKYIAFIRLLKDLYIIPANIYCKINILSISGNHFVSVGYPDIGISHPLYFHQKDLFKIIVERLSVQ
jgi:hypothetical protein